MAWWTTAMMAVSTVVASVGAAQQAQAARSQAQFQAAQANRNSAIAQQNAADVRDRGKAAEEELRDKIAQTKSAVKADQAPLGFLIDDPGSTNVDLAVDVAEAGELDILKQRDEFAREERRALIQGENFTAQAQLFSMKAAGQSPGMQAGGTFLSGAASAAGNYAKLTAKPA